MLSFSIKGYLADRGWITSYKLRQAVDAQGAPIPWLTYSLLDFLEGRLNRSISLFEYGSGNSTLYFADRVGFIQSVEYDKAWFDLIQQKMPGNVELTFTGLEGDGYQKVILEAQRDFDIILIDGRRRVECLKNSVQRLSPGGVLLLDDSEREDYREAFTFMQEKGFRHIPFSGIAIGSIHGKCTSVFYRPENVLGI
ncbi:MAG: FkbM family methyltransferase [Leadbetterella sp.]|nr:FkbM family methyltransferase [Leadbetterella sp.]